MTRKNNWRLVPTTINNAFENMAIDEATAESVGKEISPSTIRFYRWTPSAVSIGYFQSMEKEVNSRSCREANIDIVRRRTGGGAVFHDSEGEITYSVIAPETLFSKDLIVSYEEICRWIINGLHNLGINAVFSPINDILVNGKKISGNAQTRRNNVLQQHGTILIKPDIDKMFNVLRVSDIKIRDKLIKNVKERITSLSDHTHHSREEIEQAMISSFSHGKEISQSNLSEEERARAEELVKTKYATREWNWWR